MKKALSFKGTQFASIKNYVNSYGEVATYKVLLGASYEKARLKDIETLKNTSFSDKELEIARLNILNGFLSNLNDKTRSNQSIGQIDAYVNLGKGLRLHKQTGEVKLLARLIQKKQSQSQKETTLLNQKTGLFKKRTKVNHSNLTLNKQKVCDLLNLKTNQIVQFTLKSGKLEKAKINGRNIIF